MEAAASASSFDKACESTYPSHVDPPDLMPASRSLRANMAGVPSQRGVIMCNPSRFVLLPASASLVTHSGVMTSP
jgi:hypothetical protein